MLPSPDTASENIILTNIHGEADFMSQITEVHKKTKERRETSVGKKWCLLCFWTY